MRPQRPLRQRPSGSITRSIQRHPGERARVESAIETYRERVDLDYDRDISDSIIFGWHPMADIKGGTVDRSIIAGRDPLDRANIHVNDSYIITPDQTKYIDAAVQEMPEQYTDIPAATNNAALFR